jgi:hypothetical protein
MQRQQTCLLKSQKTNRQGHIDSFKLPFSPNHCSLDINFSIYKVTIYTCCISSTLNEMCYKKKASHEGSNADE